MPCVQMEVVGDPACAGAQRSRQRSLQLLALFAASGTSGPSSAFVEVRASFLPTRLVSFLLLLAALVFLTRWAD